MVTINLYNKQKYPSKAPKKVKSEMTDTPREFIDFFDKEFSALLDKTEIPGMQHASWDRRAAWLVWTMRS